MSPRAAPRPSARGTRLPGWLVPVGLVLLVVVVLVAQRALQGGGPADWEVPRAPLEGMSEPVRRQVASAVAAVDERPASAAAWGRLGSLYDLYELDAAALECYARARELDPDDFGWAYFTALVLERGEATLAEVETAFDEAIALDPSYVAARYRYGLALLDRGEGERALAVLRQVAERRPDLALAHRGVGSALLALDRPAEAIEPLERALELHPTDRAAATSLADALRRTGAAERAAEVAAAVPAEATLPDLPDPVRGRLGRLGVDPDSSIGRAQEAMARREFARAVPDLLRFLEALPDHAIARYFLGTCYYNTGKPKQAIEQFELALAADDTIPEAHHLLASLLAERGRRDEALEHMRRALELRPDDARLQGQIGLALAQLGDLAGGIAGLARAAELEPHDVGALHNLGTALMRDGQWAAAAERFREALRLEPGSADSHYNLGTALEHFGKREAALEHYRRAAEIRPDHLAARRLAELEAAR